MLPYLELVLLFISLVYKRSNGVSSCRVSFSNQGHALVGHLIRTLEKKTFESCTFSCELEPQCYSVNYVASRKTCELNNASKDYFPDDLISRKGAFYMEMVIRVYQPCGSMRCENGGTCVVSPSVHCKCLQGFSGLRCENVSVLQPLGMESGAIADSKITASSIEGGHEAWKGRLNGNSSWMPSRKTDTEFIKVTFTATKTVVAIATQGAPDASCWVKSYGLQLYSGTTGKSGTLISKVYRGNVDKNSVVTNMLTPPILADWIRINPQEWYSCIALRIELFGY